MEFVHMTVINIQTVAPHKSILIYTYYWSTAGLSGVDRPINIKLEKHRLGDDTKEKSGFEFWRLAHVFTFVSSLSGGKVLCLSSYRPSSS